MAPKGNKSAALFKKSSVAKLAVHKTLSIRIISISEKKKTTLRLKPLHLLVKASNLNDCSENIMAPMPPKQTKAIRSIGHQHFGPQKNSINWNRVKSPKSATPVGPKYTSSASLVVQYRSMAVAIECPVCNAPFNLITLLLQHLSIQHFNAKLTAMVSATIHKRFSCPDPHCSFSHPTRQVVLQHMSTNHLLAFDIAKKIFPDFSVPAPVVSFSTSSM